MNLPTIKVKCAECNQEFECKPDDLLGYDRQEQPWYLCPKCESVLFSLLDEDDEQKGGDPHA
jgi:hypothetical protein